MKLLTTKLVKKRSTVLVSVAQFCTALLVFSQDIRDVLELVVAENLGGNAPDAVFTFNLNVTSSSSNETNIGNNAVVQTLPVRGEADLFVTM